ncbi:MAG TPA: M1 family aminopeptidase [Thermoanaerobaculia bacterium]|nr:M1 family aminopeptidase [Thermoanaerobaculia bacterium]
MFAEIFRFEARFHLKQLLFYVALIIFFLLTFGAVTSDSVQIGGSIGNVNRNAPFVIMQFLLIMSVFSIFTTTAFVSNAALRDYDLGTDSLFFSSPIRKRDYLLGRFAGAIFISFLIYIGVVLGIMIGSFMPWLEKERIGGFTLTPYVFSLLVLILPSLLLIGAIFFAIAALTRSTMATYAGAVALLVGYVVVNAIVGNSLEWEKTASLFDPFGLTPFAIATRYWTVHERNTQVLALQGVFLWNRILWLGVAFAIFAFTMARFRFEAVTNKRRRKVEPRPSPAAVEARGPASLLVVRRFDTSAWLSQFASTVGLELATIMKSVTFIVLVVLGLVNTISGASFADDLFDTKIYPVTGVMVRVINGAFLLFALIIITFYAGEIVWRERQLKLNEVADSMPAPNSAVWAGKLAALISIVYMLLVAATLGTVIVQSVKGYHNYEFALYGKAVFLQTGIPLVLLAVLAFGLQVVLNNKYLGFLVMLLYFVSLPVLPAMHFEHNLYRLGQTPPAPYSDMNGYGQFVAPIVWFNLYWTLFAGLLVIAAHLLWVRGTDTAWRYRARIARLRFGRPAAIAFAVLAIAFVATGSFIFYNTNVLNRYRTSEDAEKRQATYEKKYKRYEYLPMPKITDAQADVDIFPERRALSIRGSYRLVNRTGAPLSELHVSMSPDVPNYSVSIPGATVRMADKELGYTIYRLSPPLAPGASLPMRYAVAVESHGFVNGTGNTDIVANGTFINNFAYFPHLGYVSIGELQDRNKRKKYGLPPVQRLPKIDDPRARNVNELTGESDWMNLDTTVSTSPDQIAIAPGYLQKEWTANGRRYFRYKTTSPILGFWSYLSARYQVKRDRWKDVNIEIYYDAKHPYNVQRMIDGVKRSLDYYTANFSPYQHKQVRILEFPRYGRFAQSFPNTIPFSESIGFIADLRDKNAIDYVFYVTAHEVAHQWWAHQVIGAQVQGATMITETMAQYSALMVMEKEYGRDKMRKFLAHELNSYLQGRGGELVAEMPLMLVENQPYIHYRKGSLVMYALRDYAGEENVDAALRRIIGRWGFQGPPYVRTVDLVNEFRASAPPQEQSIIHDLFETITLYDNKATEVTSTKLPDGRYRVRFTVESQKFRADGQGTEKPVPVDDWIDVGVLAAGASKKADDKVLVMEKRHITRPKNTFEFIVNEKPSKAGIDPLNKLIDRNPDDNTKKVTSS